MEVSTLTMVLKNSFYKEDMTDGVKRKQSDKAGSRHPCSKGWKIGGLQHPRGTKFNQIR